MCIVSYLLRIIGILCNQKVEIGKKPIQIVFEEQLKTLKKEAEKKVTLETKKTETLIHTMKNKTMEREMGNIKK